MTQELKDPFSSFSAGHYISVPEAEQSLTSLLSSVSMKPEQLIRGVLVAIQYIEKNGLAKIWETDPVIAVLMGVCGHTPREFDANVTKSIQAENVSALAKDIFPRLAKAISLSQNNESGYTVIVDVLQDIVTDKQGE